MKFSKHLRSDQTWEEQNLLIQTRSRVVAAGASCLGPSELSIPSVNTPIILVDGQNRPYSVWMRWQWGCRQLSYSAEFNSDDLREDAYYSARSQVSTSIWGAQVQRVSLKTVVSYSDALPGFYPITSSVNLQRHRSCRESFDNIH